MDNGSTHGHPADAADVQPVITHNLGQLPARLRRLHRWVCWRYQIRNGKPTKIPFDAKSGREASSTDPQTWSSLAEVVHALGNLPAALNLILQPDRRLVLLEVLVQRPERRNLKHDLGLSDHHPQHPNNVRVLAPACARRAELLDVPARRCAWRT